MTSERLGAFVLRVRPAQFGVLLKRLLRIRRQWHTTPDGLRLWVDPATVFGQELLSTGQYEPSLTRLVRELLRPGDTFVDVGANEGYFSVLAHAATAGGVVIGIEPQSRLHTVLRANAEANGMETFRLVPAALGEVPGEVTLYLRPNTNTGASSTRRWWRLGSSAEVVPVQTLDAVLNGVGPVRLVKVDCEGAEGEVLGGAKRTLTEQQADYWVVEAHAHIIGWEGAAAVQRTMREAGYVLTARHGIGVDHRPELEIA